MGASCFALWKPASSSSTDSSSAPLARLAEAFQRSKGVSGQARHVMQVRAYRAPVLSGPNSNSNASALAQAQKKSGSGGGSASGSKTLYILRSNFETAQIFIDDPSATSEDLHNRMTVMSVAAPSFEQLLQRTLAAPTGGNNAIAQSPGWTPKPPSLSVEGTTWVMRDYILKAGAISHRGGQGSGPAGRFFIELEYLPATSLSTHAIFEEFLSDLIPAKELAMMTPEQAAAVFESVSLDAPGSQDEEGNARPWNDRHRASCAISLLRSNALL